MATVNISGVDLEVEECGSGRPLLFLHAGEGAWCDRPWFGQLGDHFRVIAPAHPGWSGSSLPDWVGTVDDLAYLYLDLARQMNLTDAVLVGASFGGWIAAEMAVRSTDAFAQIVLAAPLGIKVGGRTARDIADMHSMPYDAFAAKAWADPKRDPFDPKALSDDELKGVVEGREALALFGWKPYMHNPRLRHWLHRIDKPVQVIWGENDQIIDKSYCEAWVAALAQGRLATIADCGHFPMWEQPEVFVERIATFAGSSDQLKS